MTANRPLNLVRAKTSFGKRLWDPDCRRPLLRKDAFSLPNSIGRRSNSPPCASISARARFYGGRLLRQQKSKRSTKSAVRRRPRRPPTENVSMSISGSYGLVSYDFDGKLLWERRLPLSQNIYGAVASPIVAGDLLVLNHQGKDAYLLAVNRRDGKTVWKTDRSKFQYGWSTPVYWRHDGIDEIVVLGGDFGPNQRLMAYNLADGAERWWVAGLPPCGKSTPVIGGDMVFFAAPDIILNVEAEKRNPERAAQFYANNASRVMAIRPGGKSEVSQTHVAWTQTKGVPGVPSPLYYNGRIYTVLNGGIVFSRVAKTGELVYSGRTGAMGYYYSSPVAADNKIYLASEEGVVVVLDGGEELKVLARNKLNGQILATPAIVDGKIYVRTEDYLYAFGR
ncbi:MAG TPA: PQQ-binding-like beta-propeller repeat protein [Bryobacteraceae bacterium]|nr:PQQ-binding-like beta-propeller repeat protein [Bryobacteraceae bacterium]